MRNFTLFCKTCGTEKDIVSVQRIISGNCISTTYGLSCGHKHNDDVFADQVKWTDAVKTQHFNEARKLLDKYILRLSGQTKRPTKVDLIIDRETRARIHTVWEQNEKGEWEIKHGPESTPFNE